MLCSTLVILISLPLSSRKFKEFVADRDIRYPSRRRDQIQNYGQPSCIGLYTSWIWSDFRSGHARPTRFVCDLSHHVRCLMARLLTQVRVDTTECAQLEVFKVSRTYPAGADPGFQKRGGC